MFKRRPCSKRYCTPAKYCLCTSAVACTRASQMQIIYFGIKHKYVAQKEQFHAQLSHSDSIFSSHNTAVLSKKAVSAILVKNEMTTLYGFLHHYLTLCKARKPYLHFKVIKIANQKGCICNTPTTYNRKKPYVHAVFLSGMFLQLRLSLLYSCCRYGFLSSEM